MEWLRNASIWKYHANYFPVKLVKTAELDPDKGNYLLGNHPHGLLCAGAFASFGTDGAGWSKIFPNLIPSLLTLQVFHQAPGIRELFVHTGDNMKLIYAISRSWRFCGLYGLEGL